MQMQMHSGGHHNHDHHSKSFLNDYSKVCTTCGSAAILIAGVYFVIAILLRSYLNSDTLTLFESVPTYIPAISYLICGLSTVACAWKPYRNVILLNITSLISIVNAGLSSVITIAVIFVNFKSYNAMDKESCVNPEEAAHNCHCVINPYSPAFPLEKTAIFENTACTSAIYVLNACLLIMTLTSIFAIFLSVFLCRLLDELAD